MPSILIAVPSEHRSRLEQSFFGRADMQRTFASPEEVVSVARTLGPDVVIVTADGPVRSTVDAVRQESLTRDTVVVILANRPESVTTAQRDSASLVLPYDLGESDRDAGAPWAERLEALLRMRRRRDTRVTAHFAVDLWLSGPERRRRLAAEALNLSSRGVLITSAERIPMGARVDLAFTAGEGLPQVLAVGEVVRSAETVDRWLSGVHFVVIRKEARLAIRDTLRALRPADDAPASEPAS